MRLMAPTATALLMSAAAMAQAPATFTVGTAKAGRGQKAFDALEVPTQTERASFLITTQVVEQADLLIDLHGGDIDESLRPYSYWTKTGNDAQDDISLQDAVAPESGVVLFIRAVPSMTKAETIANIGVVAK